MDSNYGIVLVLYYIDNGNSKILTKILRKYHESSFRSSPLQA
jgi:hypothetical protein